MHGFGRLGPRGFRVLVAAVALLAFPFPAPTVAATNAGQAVTKFFECTDPNWQQCATGGSYDNVTAAKANPTSNEESVRYGFRFPVHGVAASADLDMESIHGYKDRQALQNNQGTWNQPTANFSNTTSLFGLRIDLDRNSPFYAPLGTNANVSFSTGQTNYDVAAGDFNGDGKDDLAVLAGNNVQIRTYAGGNWLNYSTYALSTGSPMGLKQADLNLDGRLDLVVVTTSSYIAYVYNLIQTPYGSMRLEGPITLTSACCSTVMDFDVGDLSGDGYPDVAVVESNRTAYWVNDYAGKNLDFWGANDYSIKAQSTQYTNRANFIASAPSNCSAWSAAANLNNNIYVFWQSNLTAVATLSNHTGAVNGLAWSSDCAYLASASSDKSVILWRTSNWTVAATLTSHNNTVYGVAFSPDNTLLATGGADGMLKVWNLTVSPPNLDYNVSDNNGTIYSLAFSPNGSFIAAGTGQKVVRVRTTSDYSLVANLTGHNFSVRSVAYSPDGLTLVSGSDDDKMFVWSMVNFTKSLERTVFGADVYRVAFSPNGSRLITASLDGHVRVFSSSDWSLLDDVIEGSVFVYGADFDSAGVNILTAGTSNYVRLWDKSVLTSVSRLQTKQEFSVLGVRYSDTGLLASAAEDGTVLVEWAGNGTIVKKLAAHNGTANAVAFSPGSALMATAGSDGVVHIFYTGNWSVASNLTLAGNVTAVDFSDLGNYIAAGSSTGALVVWTASNFSQVSSSTAPAAVNSLAFSPTGASLVSGGADATVHIWNTTGGSNFQNLTEPTGTLRGVDWSPDGSLVAAGGSERRLRIWWTSNWTLAGNVSYHSNDITGLAFAPDSTKVATVGLDALVLSFGRDGTLLQQYAAPPPNPTLILSMAWSPDSRRIAAGWQDNRFPINSASACPGATCNSQITAAGIAIGPADTVAGNDIIIVGAYKSSWQPDSGAFRLGFSSGSGSAWSAVAPGTNSMPDASKVVLGDLTGDGRPDMAVAADTAGSGSLYLLWWNTTSNNWDSNAVVTVPLDGSANELAIADVTDDGHNDVVVACGQGSNAIDVVYYEENARSSGAFKMTNVSKYSTPAAGNAPEGIAIGHFNNDSLNDTAAANGAAGNVWIYLQKDELFGSYTSAYLTDAQLPGNPIVAATLYWDDWNVVANVTTYNASISVDSGFTWLPLVENRTIDLNGTNSTYIQYRFDFRSSHAGVTAWVLAVWILYTLETTAQNISLDVARDFSPANGDCYYPGRTLGLQHCTFSPDVINQYILDNWNLQDVNGTLYIPIRIKWERPAAIRLSNLSIFYNFWPDPPILLSPASGTFADATPTFRLTSADSDSDNLRYDIQVSGDSSFTSIAREYDQNNTPGTCWGLPFYVAGANATCTTPDSERLSNGQKYYWRARAFDGFQWSLWSAGQDFTVDDLAPEGYASSPAYSTVTDFRVSWSANDPPGGSGLAPAPFDVQYSDGLTGAWQDWQTQTASTSATFSGLNGHTYCFRMRAVDVAGNQQLYITSAAGDTCTAIDTDRPTASIVGLPPYEQSRTFEVRWSGDDGVGGTGTSAYDVDVEAEGGAWAPWLSAFSGDHATYTAPADKLFSFRVAARDRAGNIGAPSEAAATRVDTSPPSCTVTVPAATTTSLANFPLTFSCSDPDTGVALYEYSIGKSPGTADVLSPVPVTSPVALITNLSLENGGTYFANVHARNAAGAWSAWIASRAVRVLIPGPEAHLEYPAGVYTSTNLTVGLSSSDALGYPVVASELQYRRATFRYNQLSAWEDWLTIPVDPAALNFSFEQLIRGYAYEFQYRARNSVGSWGDYAAGATLFVNQLPVASAGADRIANLSEEITLDGTGSLDYDGARDTLTYVWELDDGRMFNSSSANVSFTQPGTHRAVLTVSDGHEQATATVSIYVPPPAPRQVAPGFEGAALLAALVGVAFALAGRRRKRAA